ncbi:hypothetical protein EJ05DRAFT_486727 [Pseudovirgaria hyperparasitica]|uniref:Uncharacterized protein n=1 Tax=Pseudovirgaria hyperparasitica TaxID=470096 RepID=A0A6A6W9D8_9PEZI|nr:uncharacterized protein EJ05DRAFT_486727 [Pseudovirgaria hyperparasitica]KAF2757701.1 hypothetical protein EJ05DRAFT_486727 [Pseudovirgaria hyperparasitica]
MAPPENIFDRALPAPYKLWFEEPKTLYDAAPILHEEIVSVLSTHINKDTPMTKYTIAPVSDTWVHTRPEKDPPRFTLFCSNNLADAIVIVTVAYGPSEGHVGEKIHLSRFLHDASVYANRANSAPWRLAAVVFVDVTNKRTQTVAEPHIDEDGRIDATGGEVMKDMMQTPFLKAVQWAIHTGNLDQAQAPWMGRKIGGVHMRSPSNDNVRHYQFMVVRLTDKV